MPHGVCGAMETNRNSQHNLITYLGGHGCCGKFGGLRVRTKTLLVYEIQLVFMSIHGSVTRLSGAPASPVSPKTRQKTPLFFHQVVNGASHMTGITGCRITGYFPAGVDI